MTPSTTTIAEPRSSWPQRFLAAIRACRQGENLIATGATALARECRKNQALLRNISDGLHILDSSGRLIEASHAFFRMLGYQREELIGQPLTRWWPKENTPPMSLLDEHSSWQEHTGVIEAQFRCKDGSLLDVEMTAFAIELDGQSHISLSARDIGERRKAAEQIRLLAFYDALTGLANRRLLMDRLGKALAQAQRNGHMMAVMFLDLDKFKQINDSLGHNAGDVLLKEVAYRLSHSVRTGDTVARQGGDEFVIVLSEIATPTDAELVAQKILLLLTNPIMLFGQPYHTSCSIGISVFQGTGSCNEQTLMQQADIAMYQAKQEGRNTYRLHRQAQPAFSNSLQP